jgi:chromate transporter
VPGPLFTFAAYLGAVMDGPLSGWVGGIVFLLAIFLPGCLLAVGALPFRDSPRHRAGIRSTMAGISTGVVGILAAARRRSAPLIPCRRESASCRRRSPR